MTAPFRICVRCQLDAIAAAPANLRYSSAANIRRQSAISFSQWRSRRAYSDTVTGQDAESTPAPAPENPEHQNEEFQGYQVPLDESDGSKVNAPAKSNLMQRKRKARTLGAFKPLPDLSITDPTAARPAIDLSFTPTVPPGLKPPWASPGEPHNCKSFRDISADDLNQPFYIRGWLVQLNILSDHLIFGKVMQDGQVIQIIHTGDPEFRDPDYLRKTSLHTPVQIYGFLRWKNRLRPGQTFEDMPFLEKIELVIKDVVHIGNPPAAPVIRDTVHSPEKRYLQLRTDRQLGQALRLRHKVNRVCRQHLEDEGFLEVETPLLFKSTPEGAREFLVPTRKPGHVYALPQSPQQYKQILMAGGVHKYFQFAKCFRDEDLRADRQPEFTQLDMEMAFASGADVMRTVERLLKRLWWEVFGIRLDAFPVLRYHNAISQYGSDKPDLRFEPQILKLGEIIDPCLTYKPAEHSLWDYQIMIIRDVNMSYSHFSKLLNTMQNPQDDTVSPMGGPDPDVKMCYLKDLDRLRNVEASFLKLAPYLEKDMRGFNAAIDAMRRRHLLDQGSIVVIGRRKREFNSGGSTPIGIVRKMLATKLVQYNVIPPLAGFKFVWVNKFPLFTRIEKDDNEPGQSGSAGYKATHHPFTAPSVNDRDKLFIAPWQTTGQHYDIVLNGVEIGGGSTRIHEAELQRSILEDILKVSPEKLEQFKHLFEMLDSGCPPHAGLALGFDRLVALMFGTDSIRNVIAFPKNSKGVDPVVDSPALANSDILKEYGLARLETSTETEKRDDTMIDEMAVEDEMAENDFIKQTERVMKSSAKATETVRPADSVLQEQSSAEKDAVVSPPTDDVATKSAEVDAADVQPPNTVVSSAEEVDTDGQLSKLQDELSDLHVQMEALRDIASQTFAEEKRAIEAQFGWQTVPEPANSETILLLKEEPAAVEIDVPQETPEVQVSVYEPALPQVTSEEKLEIETHDQDQEGKVAVIVKPVLEIEQLESAVRQEEEDATSKIHDAEREKKKEGMQESNEPQQEVGKPGPNRVGEPEVDPELEQVTVAVQADDAESQNDNLERRHVSKLSTDTAEEPSNPQIDSAEETQEGNLAKDNPGGVQERECHVQPETAGEVSQEKAEVTNSGGEVSEVKVDPKPADAEK
ncbi:hypothetical protein ABW21_db0207231 [Orbilia brochopaga]|nr:hypothetical protein ABW21_db0207231 [Drechslerella brochopaga]